MTHFTRFYFCYSLFCLIMKSNIIRHDYTLLGLFILAVAGIFYLSIFFSFFLLPIEPLILLIGLTFLINKLRIGKSLSDIGLHWDKSVTRNSIYTVSFIALTIAIVFIISLIFDQSPYFQNLVFVQDFSENNQPENNYYFYGIANLLILVIIEELVFRGVAFQILIDRLGERSSLVISSVIFAGVHFVNPAISYLGMLNLFLAGLLMGLMYIKSRSLYPMIIFHFAWNFALAYIISSPVSGRNFSGSADFAVNHTSTIQTLLLGGAFGLEEALLTTFLLIIMMALVNRFFKK
jgi:membrane protease YdiL (CAAX protease family)